MEYEEELKENGEPRDRGEKMEKGQRCAERNANENTKNRRRRRCLCTASHYPAPFSLYSLSLSLSRSLIQRPFLAFSLASPDIALLPYRSLAPSFGRNALRNGNHFVRVWVAERENTTIVVADEDLIVDLMDRVCNRKKLVRKDYIMQVRAAGPAARSSVTPSSPVSGRCSPHCSPTPLLIQYKPDPNKDKLVTLDHTLQYRQCWNEVELTDMYMTKGTSEAAPTSPPDPRLPIPASRSPPPDPRLPIPASRFPPSFSETRPPYLSRLPASGFRPPPR